MNERIRELAERAHEYTDQVISSSGWSNGDEIFEEKFAELIIRECANTASDFIRGPGGDHGVKRVIHKHFGVEE